MQTSLTDRLLIKSRRSAVSLTIIIDIAYLILVAILVPQVGGEASALVILPAAVGAWALGLRGGLLNTLVLIAVNFSIFLVDGSDIATAFGLVTGPGSLSVFVVAFIFGSLRALLIQVREQSAMLTEERAALQREIAERRKAQEELAAINQELDQFAYVVSHDLKAPLRAIDNLAGWIKEDMGEDLPPDVADHIRLMQQRVGRMRDLINGVLEYSRAGRYMAEPEPVVVDQLLAGVIDSLAPPPGLTMTVGPGMPRLVTEKIKLEQVLSNLLSNAIKYHDKPNGRIAVTVQETADFYEFSVADDGPGIPPQHHDKIFGMFQSVFVKEGVESSGVGLAVVKKIVEEQGGDVTLEPTVGEGATFRFTWPR